MLLFYEKYLSKLKQHGLLDTLSEEFSFNPINTGRGVFPPPICFLTVTFCSLANFPQNWQLFPEIEYRIRRKIKIFGI